MINKILAGLLLLSSSSLFAQYDSDYKPFHFGVGTALSLPLGSLKTGTVYGVGIEIQPSYAFTESIEGFLQTGIHVFKGTSSYGYDDPSILHIPLLAGARFKASGFYAGAGIGYGLFTADGESAKGFMYSPQVGYDFDRYEVGLHYSSTQVTGGSLSYIGLRAFRKF